MLDKIKLKLLYFKALMQLKMDVLKTIFSFARIGCMVLILSSPLFAAQEQKPVLLLQANVSLNGETINQNNARIILHIRDASNYDNITYKETFTDIAITNGAFEITVGSGKVDGIAESTENPIIDPLIRVITKLLSPGILREKKNKYLNVFNIIDDIDSKPSAPPAPGNLPSAPPASIMPKGGRRKKRRKTKKRRRKTRRK